MRKEAFDRAIKELVRVKIKALDMVLKDVVAPLKVTGSPEELLGKPYSQWSPQDLQRMILIYGEGENTPLSNLIFRREYEKVKDLEQEEADYA